jgi:hypothetical protein
MHKRILAAIAFSTAFCCADVLAQDKVNPKLTADECDMSFTSTVKAKSLKVDVVGHPKVQFHGSANRQVLFDAKRTGFPKPVQAGKTYNNIRIDTKIFTKFTDPEKGTNDAPDSTSGGVPARDASSGAASGAGSGQNIQPEQPAKNDK